MSKSLKTGERNGTTAELPGMPDGTVSKGIRATAEGVILMRAQLRDLRDTLKEQEEKLMMDMGREGIRVAVVVLNDRKFRLIYKGSSPKIGITEEGISPAGLNGQASKTEG